MHDLRTSSNAVEEFNDQFGHVVARSCLKTNTNFMIYLKQKTFIHITVLNLSPIETVVQCSHGYTRLKGWTLTV